MFQKRKSVAPDDIAASNGPEDIPSDSEQESPTCGNSKDNLWAAVLKKHWKKRGFTEIGADHKYDFLTQCIRAGIRDFIDNQPRIHPEIILHEEDFSSCLTREVSIDGKTFNFCTYASAAFATLRRAIGVNEKEYFRVITDPTITFYEFLSNSRSNRTLFVTHDKAFFIKIETKESFSVCRNMLREYVIHFLRYPHSLLVKVVGLYSIHIPDKKPTYLFIMQSVFNPDERLEAKYDIKGCLAGRFTQVNKVKNQVVVLKDKNFLEENFKLGGNKSWFIRQMELDLDFLCRQRVMDYSMLVGKHPLSPSDLKQDAADLFTSAARSLHPTENNASHHQNGVLKAAVEKEIEKEEKVTQPASENHKRNRKHSRKVSDSGRLTPVCNIDNLLTMLNSSDGATSTTDNRRLLINAKNSLHIVDGQNDRYFLGIVDFFTPYSFRQKVAAVFKSIIYCGRGHSSVNANKYSTRMLQFFRDNTK